MTNLNQNSELKNCITTYKIETAKNQSQMHALIARGYMLLGNRVLSRCANNYSKYLAKKADLLSLTLEN